jgi:hypothetical protein
MNAARLRPFIAILGVLAGTLLLSRAAAPAGPGPPPHAPIVSGVVVHHETAAGVPDVAVVVSWIENVPDNFPQALATVQLRTRRNGTFTTAGTARTLPGAPTWVWAIAHAPGRQPAVVTAPVQQGTLALRLEPYGDDTAKNVAAIGKALVHLVAAWAAKEGTERPSALATLRQDWLRLPAGARAKALGHAPGEDDFTPWFDFWLTEHRGLRDTHYLGPSRRR